MQQLNFTTEDYNNVMNNMFMRADFQTLLAKEIAARATEPKFNGKTIKVEEAAKILGKDVSILKMGLISGTLPIGCAVQTKKGRYAYHISPLLLYRYSGYIYEPALEREEHDG